jgi:hypothetical protein
MQMPMNQEQIELKEKTQQLLSGPLKHVRAAALAAALLPLASVAVSPASAQNVGCASGGVCGFVFSDTNNNGTQDAGEPGIEAAVVTISGTIDGNPVSYVVATDADGFYYAPPTAGTFTVTVQVPPGSEASTPNVGSDDAVDSDGVTDGQGNSVATVTFEGADSDTDFGFVQTVTQPGTGTPGYWKNHPEAWPVATIIIGGREYTKAQAIAWLEIVGKDKTTTMFSSLVSARLNVIVGNNPSCVAGTILSADAWMAVHPVGSGVHASSLAWKLGEPLHRLMDNYNNGMLCAPHRN